MKIKPLLILAGVFLLGITACKSVVPQQPDTEELVYTGTLRIGLHSSFWKKDIYQPGGKPDSAGHLFQTRSAAFMEKYPGVRIEFVDVAYDRNFRQMLDDPSLMPDIFELTVNEARLMMKDRIVSLAEFIEDEADRWEGDYLKVVDLAEIDGEAYVLPVTSNPMLVFYETEPFVSEGIELPREGWTLEEYAAIGRRLVDEGYTVYNATDLNGMEPFIVGLGGKYTETSGLANGTLDSEATVNAFVRYGELLNATALRDQYTDHSYYDRMGMFVGRSTKLFKDHWKIGVAALPDATDGKRYNNALVTGLAISKEARQPELAWEYMKHMLGGSSDEAMDAVVTYTLEAYGPDASFQGTRDNPPSLEDTKRWMRHEITVSPPATFDMAWLDGGNREEWGPQRPVLTLMDYNNYDTAKGDLTNWAVQLDSYAAALAEAGAVR